jgi:hypothetical protein
MRNIRIVSVEPAFEPPSILEGLIGLVSRVAAMGLIEGKPIERLDAKTIDRVLDALQNGGMIGAQRARLVAMLRATSPKGALLDDANEAIRQLITVLEESPVPRTEWPAMREVFGDEVLAELLCISASSLKRYAGEERETPPKIAERLHWVAMIVADLAGSYNDFGMRRWFERSRTQLDGRSPRKVLGTEWSPNDPAARRVRALAASLVGAGAT